jgi:transmembrane sensor
MKEKELSEFLEKFSGNQHTEQEHDVFLNWIRGLSRAELEKVMDRYQELGIEFNEMTYPQLAQKIEDRLNTLDVDEHTRNRTVKLWPKLKHIAIAGMLILCTAAGLYYFNATQKHNVFVGNKVLKNRILQGGNKAVLSLADGSEIVLDAAKVGKLAEQGHTAIYKEKDGQVVFDASALSAKSSEITYNLLSTPRGGQYMLKLPDGSKVWLNSASSLRFPTAFSGKERMVELTGEGYFEVVKDKTKPFRVKTATQSVEVLGTHFNINAYPEEPAVATTLLEGSVRITRSGTDKIQFLKPGQQARLTTYFTLSEVDPENFVDWKDGCFRFSRENIQSIMRKVSRWYDVDVVYEGIPTKEGFVGTVPRSKEIKEVLNALKLTGVMNYRIEGKQVIITP